MRFGAPFGLEATASSSGVIAAAMRSRRNSRRRPTRAGREITTAGQAMDSRAWDARQLGDLGGREDIGAGRPKRRVDLGCGVLHMRLVSPGNVARSPRHTATGDLRLTATVAMSTCVRSRLIRGAARFKSQRASRPERPYRRGAKLSRGPPTAGREPSVSDLARGRAPVARAVERPVGRRQCREVGGTRPVDIAPRVEQRDDRVALVGEQAVHGPPVGRAVLHAAGFAALPPAPCAALGEFEAPAGISDAPSPRRSPRR